MRGIQLTVSEELRGRLRLGVVCAAPVRVAPSNPALLEEMRELGRRLQAAHAGKAPAQIADLQPARELYKVFGIDPTKVRPSSEALLRRVLKDKPLPRISNAVDLCNLLALEFLLPLGLYDLDKVHGPVLLRAGRPGESFAGIRKDEVHVEERPVLVDDDGPFGNPSSDSLRTCVGEATRALGMVIFAPVSVPPERMARHVQATREGMERHLVPGGRAGCCTGDVLG
jgi:DNA/RNA-binding domain of Phe-tRNA-synthetase-like protein